jgi:hypothetical protein
MLLPLMLLWLLLGAGGRPPAASWRRSLRPPTPAPAPLSPPTPHPPPTPRLDGAKALRVYDLLLSCGWIPAPTAAAEGGDAAARQGGKRGQGREQQAEGQEQEPAGGGEQQQAGQQQELGQQHGAEQAVAGAPAAPAGA